MVWGLLFTIAAITAERSASVATASDSSSNSAVRTSYAEAQLLLKQLLPLLLLPLLLGASANEIPRPAPQTLHPKPYTLTPDLENLFFYIYALNPKP